MVLSKDFSDMVVARAERDPEFRRHMLIGVIDCLSESELDVAKAHMRDYVNATMGFDALADTTGHKKQSLMRMLSKSGNPSLTNFAAILNAMLAHEGVKFQTAVVDTSKKAPAKKKTAANKRARVKSKSKPVRSGGKQTRKAA